MCYDPLFEEAATLFIVLEQIEARTGRREQHHIPRTRHTPSSLHRLVERRGRDYLTDYPREAVDQLLVVQPHADERVDLLAGKIHQRAVIITLVRTSGNPDRGAGHTLKSIPHRIDIGRLRIVDPQYPLGLFDRLEAVLHGREGVDRTTNPRR